MPIKLRLCRLRHVCAICFAVLWYCSSSNITGGSSGTEVSALVGMAVDEAGNPVTNAQVRIRPAEFLEDSAASYTYTSTHSIIDTFTGTDGTFGIPKLLSGDYVVEVVKNDSVGYQAQVHINEKPVSTCNLSSAILTPLAQVTGNVQMHYGVRAHIGIQTYGFSRSATIDENGKFSMLVPKGSHRFRIAAYRSDDTAHSVEYDGMDVTLSVVSGEQREAGMFQLRPPPLQPCTDGTCDSAVVTSILRFSGNGKVELSSVITTNSAGRVTGLNCSGLDFSNGILYDIVRLSELEVLDVSGTRLTMMFPEIGRLTNLETLLLANNQLTFFSKSIGGCKKLNKLDLSNNGLFDLPLAITECSLLTTVNVNGNFLCVIDPLLATWLDTLDATWRTMQKCMPPPDFGATAPPANSLQKRR